MGYKRTGVVAQSPFQRSSVLCVVLAGAEKTGDRRRILVLTDKTESGFILMDMAVNPPFDRYLPVTLTYLSISREITIKYLVFLNFCEDRLL